MNFIVMTQYDGKFLGPIAKLLGFVMDAIFRFLNLLGIPNIGLAIILFTMLIYLLLMPFTVKQQKFSKMSARMNPELQAINNRYKDKKDNESAMAMQMETKAVYDKYGVSPTGSCVQMIIQMPILFALYRVFMNIPGYVTQVKQAFFPLVEKLASQPGVVEYMGNTEHFTNASLQIRQISNEAFVSGDITYIQNTFIDILNKASTAEWEGLASAFPSLSAEIEATMHTMERYNNFLGLNMGNSPSFMLNQAFHSGQWLLVIGALMIPILAALTQWLNSKLIPEPENSDGTGGMSSTMKMMNIMMPITSAIFCFTLPSGLGLYWIAGAVVRSVQQVLINHHLNKMDMDAVIKKNLEKRDAKLRKKGIDPEKLNRNAAINTRNVKPAVPVNTKAKPRPEQMTQEEKDAAVKKATEYYDKRASKPGSIAAKANMVRDYNERNNKQQGGR